MVQVRFCLRARPILNEEDPDVGVTLEDTTAIVHDSRHRADYKRYYFDSVYGPDATSAEIYDELLKEYLQGLFEGASSTVFLHGATGSGKTHTAEGTPHEAGLVELSVSEIYRLARDPEYAGRFKISYALFEIHCDKVRDLLGPKTDLPMRVNHQDNMTIDGLQWKITEDLSDVCAAKQAYQIYREGVTKRRVARTKLNNESSRSHCCLHFRVELLAPDEGSLRDIKKKDIAARVCTHIDPPASRQVGNFFVIDLAGAENNSKTGNAGAQLEESCSINANHFQLGQVLNALKQKKKQIPYRNSKMTRLLRSCFQEQGYTLMLVTISPSFSSVQPTINSFKTIALDGYLVGDGRQRSKQGKACDDSDVAASARPLASGPKASPRTSGAPRTPRSSSCGPRSRRHTYAASTRSSSCGIAGSRSGRPRLSASTNPPTPSPIVYTPCAARESKCFKRDDEKDRMMEKERMVKQVWDTVQAKLDSQVRNFQEQMASHQLVLDQTVKSKVASLIQEKTGNLMLSLLNYGTSWDLTRLNGVDKSGAAAIIAHRQACGPFAAVEDVLAVQSLSNAARDSLGATRESE